MAQLQATGQVRPAERTGRPGRIVGGFFLFTGGIHFGLVAADPQFYRPFADGALLPFITSAWQDIFMTNPSGWGYWLWSVPALAFLVPPAIAHWRRQQTPGRQQTPEGSRIR